MTVPVLTAVPDPRWEAQIVAALSRGDQGVRVDRRCVDLADLLAAAASGIARAALVSADLRRLDRDALARLAVAGVAVVGLHAPGDEDAQRRLRLLGVTEIVALDAAAADIGAAVLAAVGAGQRVPAHDFAHTPPRVAAAEPDEVRADGGPTLGRVAAVWGPAGAPGRTSVAVNVAAELAEAGTSVLLVDADVYGGVVAQVLGLLDESPGLAAACRLANAGALDVAALAELALVVRPRLRALTGIARAGRWPELRPSALDAVLALCRTSADITVVDCGFCLERDEELSYDTTAPRRNGATLAVLAAADTVVAVASGDPVGLQRYVRALGDLADALPGVTPLTVVNRVRRGAVGGGEPRREIAAALERYAGVHDPAFVPLDVDAFDAGLAAGRTLVEVAPGSPARLALAGLAGRLAGVPAPRRRRRLPGRGRTAVAGGAAARRPPADRPAGR